MIGAAAEREQSPAEFDHPLRLTQNRGEVAPDRRNT